MVDYNNNTGTGTGTTTTTPGSTTGSTTNTATVASPTGGTTTNPAIWTGTSGSDSKTGTAANETFNGLGGNDTIDGGGGNDTIDGGEGADTIRGGDGNDAIRGGRGGGDKLFGDAGDDAIIAVGGGSVVEGGAGNDYLFGFGDDRLLGGEGDDWIEIIDGSPYKKLDGNTGKTDFTGFIQNISGGAGTDTFVVRPNGGLNQFSSELIAALRDASFERYAFNEKFQTDVQLVLDADGYVIWEPDEHGWPTEKVTVTAPKYSSVTSIYDLNSRLVAESRIRFSDGLREEVEHDFYDTNAWKTRTKTYDTTGRLVSMVETPDSPAPTARNDTLSLQEATDDPAITTTTGNQLANDTGAEKKLLSVGTATVAEFGETVIQGTYGTLRVKQDGSYVFVLDNLRANVEALAAGQSVADVFSYRVGNDGGAAGATLTITINGANDVSIARTLTTARDVVSGTASAERIDALAGNDEISAGGGNDVVRGGDGDDVIKGDAGSDALFGDGGHDWLDGGAGTDRADGGAGNDFIFYDQADDWANGGVMGGAGTDVLVLREADGWRLHPAYDPSSIGQIVSRADGTHFTASALAAAGFERFALMTADNAGQPWAERYQIYQGVSRVGERTVFDDGRIEFRTFDFDNSQVWLEKIETTEPGKQAVTQTILDPVLRGGAGNDIIDGTSGTDTLEGGAGNDTLNGGLGQDFLDGGDGDDWIYFDPSDGLNRGNIKGGAGTDILALTADQVTAVKPLLAANGFERYAIVSRDGVVPTDKANNKFPWKELAEVFDLDGTSLFTRITSDKDMIEIREGYRKPVANGEAVLVTEDVAAAATGNLLANDPGLHLASASLATVNGETPRRLSVTSIDKPDGAKPGSLSSVTVTEGKYGFLSVDTQGNYSYRHNNALAEINALNDGQSLTDSFVYTLSDGLLNANATLVVTIRGKTDAAAGSRPVAENVTATATEDAGQDVTGNLLTHGSGQNRTVSLIDTSAVSANSSTIIQGTYGQLTVIADGTYKYSLDESRLFGLNNGQTGSEEFAYTVKNGTGQTATATLAIAVEGRTDPLTRPDQASISENATTPVTGNLFANDRPGNKSIAAVGTRQSDGAGGYNDFAASAVRAADGSYEIQGLFGKLKVFADGRYEYRVSPVDAAHAQELDRLQAGNIPTQYNPPGFLQDRFIYEATANGTSGQSEIKITINGENDQPVLHAPLPEKYLMKGEAFSFFLPPVWEQGFIYDPDGDPRYITGKASNVFGILGGLPGMLSYDGGYHFVGTVPLDAPDTISFTLAYGYTKAAGANAELVSSLRLRVQDDYNALAGTAAADTIEGTAKWDRIEAGSGNDTVTGGAGSDIIAGGAGNDTLSGDAEADRIDGGEGNDALQGGDGDDTLLGGAGKDQITGGEGDDVLEGGDGNDTLIGEGGIDFLRGGAGRDFLNTGHWANDLSVDSRLENEYEQTLADTMIADGGDGDDWVIYAQGLRVGELMTGGNGVDTLVTAIAELDGIKYVPLSFDPFVTGNFERLAIDPVKDGSNYFYSLVDAETQTRIGTLTRTADGRIAEALRDLAQVSKGQVNASGNLFANDRMSGEASLAIQLTKITSGNLAVENFGSTEKQVTGKFGTLFVKSDGAYRYQLNLSDPDTVALRADQIEADSFFYEALKDGVSVRAQLLVAVEGRATGPTVLRAELSDDRVAITEGATAPVTGNLFDNDDATGSLARMDGSNVAVTGETRIDGSYGQLFVRSDGSYRYVLDGSKPTVKALTALDMRQETFTYARTGTTDTATLTIEVTGVDTPPTINRDIPDQLVRRGETVTIPIPADHLSAPEGYSDLRYFLELKDGSEVPAWVDLDITLDPVTGRMTSGKITISPPADAPDFVDVRLGVVNLAGLEIHDDIRIATTAINSRNGTAGNDTIAGTAGVDVYKGGAGDDTLSGLAGNDELLGGGGNDTVRGGIGNDVVGGDAGNDSLFGDEGDDSLTGDDGNDKLAGGTGQDVLDGGEGNDRIDGGDGQDILAGGAGSDILQGGAGSDTIDGGSGNDFIYFDRTDDWAGKKVVGGTGTDTLIFETTGRPDTSLVADNKLGNGFERVAHTKVAGADFVSYRLSDININGSLGHDRGVLYIHSDGTLTQVMHDSAQAVEGDQSPVGGNLFDNDGIAGQPDEASIAKTVSYNNSKTDIAATGETAVRSAYGTLFIKADGTFRYEVDNSRSTTMDLGAGLKVDESFNVTSESNGKTVPQTITVGVTGRNNISAIAGTQTNGADAAEIITGTPQDDSVFSGKGDDVLRGGGGSDFMFGQDGNDMVVGEAGNDRLYGDNGNDIVIGGEGRDRVVGNAGTDVLDGGIGDDWVVHDAADDWVGGKVTGGAGVDTVVFATESIGTVLGLDKSLLQAAGFERFAVSAGTANGVTLFDLHDLATNAKIGMLTLDANRFHADALDDKADIREGQTTAATGNLFANDRMDGEQSVAMALSKIGLDSASGAVAPTGDTTVAGKFGTLAVKADGTYRYTINNSDPDTVALAQGQSAVEAFAYEGTKDGKLIKAQLLVSVNGSDVLPNRAPVVATMLADRAFAEDARVDIRLPDNIFSDPDGNALTLSAAKADGTALPTWLEFKADTRSFSGTPPLNHNGSLTVRVTATDTGGLRVFDDFVLTTTPVNDAPVLANMLLDRTAQKGVDLFFDLPAGSFTDVDNASLTYSASLDGGADLPGWLTFNATNRTFSGRPPADAPATLAIKVTASDGSLSASDVFTLALTAAPNRAPVVAAQLADRAFAEDARVDFRLPDNIFSDPDGNALTLSATLANGAALPDWLDFNATTRTFSGTPPLNHNGSLTVRVTATDTGGLKAFDDFVLTTTPVNDAPVVANALADRALAEDAAVSFQLPVNAFSDPDGNALALSAALANGAALPDWLDFNATTRTFSGTPPANHNGSLTVRVTATDTGGLKAFDDFVLTTTPVNDAPVLANALAERSAQKGVQMSFELPAGSFTDVDNASLTYSASLDGGADLPGWLTFNATNRTFSGRPPADAPATLAIRVTASDGSLSASDVFNLALTAAVNSSPPAAGADAATVVENSSAPATGNLLANDTGSGLVLDRIGSVTVAANADTVVAGRYGTLTAKADGTFRYVLDEAKADVDALDDGENRSESFAYTVRNAGGTVQSTLAVTINGQTDVPVGGYNVMIGNEQTEVRRGTTGNDSISGRGGNDRIFGRDGDDLIDGGSGSDRLFGDFGKDRIFGGEGNDRLYGSFGDDRLSGGNGHDYLYGEENDDVMFGGAGQDTVHGGDGNDHLHGQAGRDVLLGGRGNDIFYAFADGSMDEIRDFENGLDKIDLKGMGIGFANLVISAGGRGTVQVRTDDGSVQLSIRADFLELTPAQIDPSDFVT